MSRNLRVPHVSVEYSGNLEASVDMAGFCNHLLDVARGIEAFPMPGLRVRAHRADHVAIADGDQCHGFVDITIRLRAGRSDAVKADAADRIFTGAEAYLRDYMASHSLALSVELIDIDPRFAPKTGTIRRHLKSDT